MSRLMSLLGKTTASTMLLGTLVLPSVEAEASFIVSVDPKATFIRTNDDPGALNMVPIDLAANGINPGDVLLLERLGDYSFDVLSNPPRPDDVTNMIGLFSSSSTLLESNVLDRVPGSLATVGVYQPWATEPTYLGGLPTAVPNTFSINPFALVQVPTGAQFLFVSPSDSLFTDNGDPNGNYALRVTTVVPEASSLALTGFMLTAGAGFVAIRRRKSA